MENKTELLEIEYLGEQEIQFSNREHKVGRFYRLNIERPYKKEINHHLILVDVSSQMAPHFPKLYQNLVTTLEALKYGKRNYVSVILFSSHSECFRIVNTVKCDTLSYQMAQVYSIIKQNMYPRSSMILSKGLTKGIELINNLSPVCKKHQITILTTGILNPVQWSTQVEVEKCLELAKQCDRQAIDLTVIRLGDELEAKWLTDFVQTNQTGSLKQIDEIKDYHAMVVHMIKLMEIDIPIHLPISNKDYFIVDEHRLVSQPMHLNRIKKNGSRLIVTFDGPLQVANNQVIKQEKSFDLVEVGEDFAYSQAIYHLRHNDLESAQLAMIKTQDVYAHSRLVNAYSKDERQGAIDYLSHVYLHKHKRFKHGKSLIPPTITQEEPLCVLEVLKMIQEDEESTLLWDYSFPYQRIGLKNNMIEDHLRFIRPTYGYGKGLELLIGHKKLNIGLLVEILGEVENQMNRLKIDATIKREYNLIVDGTLNVQELGCYLSKSLISRFRKEKIIKKIVKYGQQDVYILALHKLRLTNKRMLTTLTPEEIVKKLYETEQLGWKLWSIKKILNHLGHKPNRSNVESRDLKGEVMATRKAFRVNEYGVYTPLGVEKQVENLSVSYQGTVIEWQIEKFPKKKEQDKAMVMYQQNINESEAVYLNRLNEDFKAITKRRHHLLDEVNLIRISCGIMGKSVFEFDQVREKKKVEHDPVLNENGVVDGKMVESIKNIDGITIRQLQYMLRLHGL